MSQPGPGPRPAHDTAPLLRIRGLSKRFSGTHAIRDITLDVPEGAFVTLLGPSGCGKTTLLRLIGGFETASEGSIELDGASIGRLPPEKRPINTVFQNYALFPHMNVRDNIAFSLSLKGRTSAEINTEVSEALRMVHLPGYETRYPGELSGGQQQRVALARAVVSKPRLLLLDEPLSALDRMMREHMQVELKDLQRELGITFLYVTHDQDEAFALSDRIVVMHGGEIVQNAAPREIYERPADRFVAEFIGGAAVVEGRLATRDGAMGLFEGPIGEVRAPVAEGLAPGAAALLSVRPENVHLGPAEASDWRVSHRLYHGGRNLIEVRSKGGLLRAWSQEEFALGAPVAVDIIGEKAWITHG